MFPSLRWFLLVVDVGFLLYWAITGLHLLPPAWLYAHHDDPVMVAWNFSFLPLDLVVSATGLSAVMLSRRSETRRSAAPVHPEPVEGAKWPQLALLSLAFTSASGLNAIAFWALRRDFELGWWAPNLVLLFGPWVFIPRLLRSRAGR